MAFKETFPSHYDPAPGGVVGERQLPGRSDGSGKQRAYHPSILAFWYVSSVHPAGRRSACSNVLHILHAGSEETYEENAVRELEEEMGIRDAAIEKLFDFWYGDETYRMWGRLFRCAKPQESAQSSLQAQIAIASRHHGGHKSVGWLCKHLPMSSILGPSHISFYADASLMDLSDSILRRWKGDNSCPYRCKP